MKTLEVFRKTTRFALATLVWSHTLFLLNPQSRIIPWLTSTLQLTMTEAILLVVLLVFTFIAGSGVVQAFLNAMYIYFFPFVLIGYVVYHVPKSLFRLASWFVPKPAPSTLIQSPKHLTPLTLNLTAPLSDDQGNGIKLTFLSVLKFMVQPFRRFTLLWCLILALSSHVVILKLALAVVLLHLARNLPGTAGLGIFQLVDTQN